MDISAIEDAFLEALAPLKAEGLRTLDSYADEIGTAELETGTRRLPAVFVVWAGGSVESVNQADLYTVQVLVLVCDQDLRGQKAARRGIGSSPGAYHWLDRCRALLNRARLLPGWTPARLLREGAVSADDRMVVYQQIYEMKARMA
jgi:phage gp37-like protein